MKKLIALFLLLSLSLGGCAGKVPVETTGVPTEAVTVPVTDAPTEIPTTAAPTQEPTEAPTESTLFTNPLTGEILEAPMESRIFAVTINNVEAAMPMYGVSRADLFFEMFVNDYCTRGLALFSDISQVSSVGSVRSMRYNFTDLCQVYDAVPVFASGSEQVLADLAASGIQGLNAGSSGGYHYRDQNRLNAGYAWEHCLFATGPETRAAAEKAGIRVTQAADRDYGLRFAEMPLDEGEKAETVTINLKHGSVTKQTVMKYDADSGRYRFHQFSQAMYDGAEKENICFDNVIVMLCNVYNDGVYHVAELIGSGEGFFAWGGRIIPIRWSHERMEDPILFTHPDGTPLELGVGSSYIAIAPQKSTVEYE